MCELCEKFKVQFSENERSFSDKLPKKPVPDSAFAGGTDRDNIMELYREDDKPKAVPQPDWKRLGIGYGPLGGQQFPEACAMEMMSLGPQGEPVFFRYSEDQPRDPDGKFASGGGEKQVEIGHEPSSGTKDFKLSDGRVLKLSNDRAEKTAQIKEFAKGEMAKLPENVQNKLNEPKGKTSEVFAHKEIGADGKPYNVYTEARREEFHIPTIDKVLEGHVAQDNPRIDFIAGGPAAGKTTETDKAAERVGDHVDINVDKIRTSAPEFTALLPDRLMGVNEETGDIRDRIMDDAGKARYNMIVDGVGSKSAAENVGKLVASGYAASYTYVHRSVDDAVQRAADRPFMTSKIADLRMLGSTQQEAEKTVREFHDKARAAVEEFLPRVSEIKFVDKSRPEFGKEGKVVFHQKDGVVLFHDDEGIRRIEKGDGTQKPIKIWPR